MKINKVKFYQFSNHFLISLHAPKSNVFARLRYPVDTSAQGSNPKVTVEYSIKLWLEFSKTNGRKKAGGYVNDPSSPWTPSTPICSLVHQSFHWIFVRFISWDAKSKIYKCHSITHIWAAMCKHVSWSDVRVLSWHVDQVHLGV